MELRNNCTCFDKWVDHGNAQFACDMATKLVASTVSWQPTQNLEFREQKLPTAHSAHRIMNNTHVSRTHMRAYIYGTIFFCLQTQLTDWSSLRNVDGSRQQTVRDMLGTQFPVGCLDGRRDSVMSPALLPETTPRC